MKFIVRIIVLLFVTEPLFAMPAQILLMRHGEKPDVGNELSAEGWKRAQLLPTLFVNRAEFKTYGLPASLYAMAPKKADGSVRAIQTLKYVSDQFNIPIETQFTRDQVSELVNNIKNDKNLDGKMIVICWEHKVLIDIAAGLGFPQLNSWPSEQFDRVWMLNFTENGKPLNYLDLAEKLLPGDSNK